MFIYLADICDSYFVPCLDLIIEKQQINHDIAGATLMAAGGSAPELFTSIIGVFIAQNDIGIGTIVGSAVFNICAVLGACAFIVSSKLIRTNADKPEEDPILEPQVLNLKAYPLMRDTFFYVLSLVLIVASFVTNIGSNGGHNEITWIESTILLVIFSILELSLFPLFVTMLKLQFY